VEAVKELSLAIGAAIESHDEPEDDLGPFDKGELYTRSQNLNAILPKLDLGKCVFCSDYAEHDNTECCVDSDGLMARLSDTFSKVAEVARPSKESLLRNLVNILDKVHLDRTAYHLRSKFLVSENGEVGETLKRMGASLSKHIGKGAFL